jgi:uncharacterized membrane protein
MGMIKFNEEIVINRPVDEVFAFLTTLENLPKWQSALTSTVISQGPVRVGTQFEESFRMMGRAVEVVCEITEHEPSRKLGWKSVSSSMIDFESRFLFDSTNGTTRLTFAGGSSLKGVWRLFEPLAGGEMRRELKAELEKMKQVVEAQS